MKLHFELLLSKKLFDEAKIALDHYENLPYVSQEVEEFMREMSQRIIDESHPKKKDQIKEYNEDLLFPSYMTNGEKRFIHIYENQVKLLNGYLEKNGQEN